MLVDYWVLLDSFNSFSNVIVALIEFPPSTSQVLIDQWIVAYECFFFSSHMGSFLGGCCVRLIVDWWKPRPTDLTLAVAFVNRREKSPHRWRIGPRRWLRNHNWMMCRSCQRNVSTQSSSRSRHTVFVFDSSRPTARKEKRDTIEATALPNRGDDESKGRPQRRELGGDARMSGGASWLMWSSIVRVRRWT